MDKVQLEILSIIESVYYDNYYNVILEEKNGNKRIIIVIGYSEAQSIAVSLDTELAPKRPLTHDLLHNICNNFNIEIIEVLINKISEGIYYSTLVCKKGDFIVEVDSRTSDAMALALRFQCPIYIKKHLLDEHGSEFKKSEIQTIEEFEEELNEEIDKLQDMDEIDVKEEKQTENPYQKNTLKELEIMLNKTLQEENYEKAAKIRDEIARRKSE
jgi:bifunctional DNase/RNase